MGSLLDAGAVWTRAGVGTAGGGGGRVGFGRDAFVLGSALADGRGAGAGAGAGAGSGGVAVAGTTCAGVVVAVVVAGIAVMFDSGMCGSGVLACARWRFTTNAMRKSTTAIARPSVRSGDVFFAGAGGTLRLVVWTHRGCAPGGGGIGCVVESASFL